MMFRVACVLLLLLLSYKLGVQPADASNIIPREELPSNCVDCRTQRTLFNIIWGCFSTTIICAWAAIHPNIPPRESPLKGTLRRLELMMWTIVVPEILPAWALNQLLAAMTVRDLYNDGKGCKQERCGIWKTVKGWVSLYEIKEAANQAWTLKHGHFLIMGGFQLIEPMDGNSTSSEPDTGIVQAAPDVVNVQPMSTHSVEATNTDTEKGHGRSENRPEPEPEHGRVTILTLEMLRELVKDPEFKIRTTEEEITHRSKGDALSKIIFILQSMWFIIQCLGRRPQGLNLTQLELTTLALASLNGITFLLWWDKPLGAQAVVRVHLKRNLTDAERNVGGRGQSGRSEITTIIQESFERRMTAIRDIILCRSEGNIFVTWLIRLPYFILAVLLSPIIAFTTALSATIFDLAVGYSSSFPADATHVPTFYVPKHRYPEYFHGLLLLALCTIFGGIHCAGWNLPFPSHPEQKLWRIASLAVTIVPIAAVPFTGIIMLIVKQLLTVLKSSSEFDETLAGWTFVISMLAYASARLVLLGQALALLRHLPPTAFIVVDWTKFYPHIL